METDNPPALSPTMAPMRSLALVSVVLVACAPQIVATKTGTVNAAAKAPDCAFDIAAAVPSGEQYVEVGVIDVQVKARVQGTGQGVGAPRSIAQFKEQAASSVCKLGGDLVVTEVNGLGEYVRGVVFAKR